MAHLTDEQLLWLYYGDTEDLPALELHVAHCADCRARFEAAKADFLALEQIPVPEPGSDFEERMWRGLVRRDAQIASNRSARLPVWLRGWRQWVMERGGLALAGGLAAMLAVAFFAGRVSGPGMDPNAPVRPVEAAREQILAGALSEHFEASERMLVELVNSGGQSASADDERQRAAILLPANRLYRMTAAREGKSELTGVLEDLEAVLLEVKNSDGNRTATVWDQSKQQDSDELLFKIRVLEQRLRQIADRPANGVKAPRPNGANSKG